MGLVARPASAMEACQKGADNQDECPPTANRSAARESCFGVGRKVKFGSKEGRPSLIHRPPPHTRRATMRSWAQAS